MDHIPVNFMAAFKQLQDSKEREDRAKGKISLGELKGPQFETGAAKLAAGKNMLKMAFADRL